MSSSRNLGHPGEDLHIFGPMIKSVVTNDAAEGLSAGHAELVLVEFLKQRALIPGRPFEFLDGFAEILFGDIENPKLQLFIRFSIVDQVVKTAPGALQRFEVLVVHDQVDLLGQLLVDFSNDRLDGFDRVVGDQSCGGQGLFGESFDRHLHGALRLGTLGLELLIEQRFEFGYFGRRGRTLLCLCFWHKRLLWLLKSGGRFA